MWPAALTLALVVGYWLTVFVKALEIRRRTGRPANFWPDPVIERMLILLWYVDITVWGSVPIWLLAGRRDAWLVPLVRSPVAAIVGAVLSAAAIGISVIAWRQMGDSWRLGTRESETTALVTSGIFGIVRHPVYAAQALLLVASVLMVPSPVYLALLAVHAGCVLEKVRIEEEYLRRTHGQAYERHAQRIGRFWPRFGAMSDDPR